MQWCGYFGQIIWALLAVLLSFPLLLFLLSIAALCGLTGEFLLCLFPNNVFAKELVERGNNLVCLTKRIVDWRVLQNNAGHLNNLSPAGKERSAAVQSTQTLVEHVINMRQQPVPLVTQLPFTIPRRTIIYGFPKIGFTFEELAAATNGFSDRNLIGKGGSGKVYKGRLLDGRHIAVKCLSSWSRASKYFLAELDLLSRVHHRHLVQLIGCCITKGKSLLAYEYVPNSSLHAHLHGQPRIIHRDIKSSNILLDDYFQPKVSDFGLGMLFPDNVTHFEVSRIAGTHGYIAPECRKVLALSEKCDIYSFGVVLLELITGKTANSGDPDPYLTLAQFMEPELHQALKDNNFRKIVDLKLRKQYNHDEMKMMIGCAAACIRDSPQERPPIKQIALVLGGKLSPESVGSIPDIRSENQNIYFEERRRIRSEYQTMDFEVSALQSITQELKKGGR